MARTKGSSNKRSIEIKQMLLNALNKAGGEKYLLKQAKENPTAFMTLVGKIIPHQLNHSGAVVTADVPLTDDQKKSAIDAIMRYQFKHGDEK